jgi:hypothetical protein
MIKKAWHWYWHPDKMNDKQDVYMEIVILRILIPIGAIAWLVCLALWGLGIIPRTSENYTMIHTLSIGYMTVIIIHNIILIAINFLRI